MSKNYWVLVFGGVLATAALAQSQSVFPLRWDEEEPDRVMGTPVDAIEADAVRLRPLDAPPVACDADHVGYMYMQNDINDTQPTYDSQLCVCTINDNLGFFWWNPQAPCSQLQSGS